MLPKQIIVNFINVIQPRHIVYVCVKIMINMFLCYKHVRTKEVKFLKLPTTVSWYHF